MGLQRVRHDWATFTSPLHFTSFYSLTLNVTDSKNNSVTQSCPTLWPHRLKHSRPPCPSSTPRSYSNSCALSRWCHPTISSSAIPFCSHFQSFPATGSFQINQFFTSGGQSIGVSASASVLPMNIQDWYPLGLIGLISLLSKGLSSVFMYIYI